MPRAKKSPALMTNRTDLAVPKGLPYGEQGQLAAVAASAAPPPSPAPGGVDAAVNAATAHPMPPGVMGLPTQRPNEPITAGADFGPGPGSTPLVPPPPNPLALAISILTGDSPDIARLRKVAQNSIGNTLTP